MVFFANWKLLRARITRWIFAGMKSRGARLWPHWSFFPASREASSELNTYLKRFQIANVCGQCQTLHFGIVFFVLHFKSKSCIKRNDLWEISHFFISSSWFFFLGCIIRVRLCLYPSSLAIYTEFLPESSTWNHSWEDLPLLTYSNNELWQCLWAHFHKLRNIMALTQT